MVAIPLAYDRALLDDVAFEELVSSIAPTASSSQAPAPARALVVSHNAFFDALRQPKLREHDSTLNPTPATANLTLTDNQGVTNASTTSATLDLFSELGSVKASSLPVLFTEAWTASSEETLKTIWVARSISRGKGDAEAWMRGAAFLAESHPQTLLRNLSELVKPTDVAPKKKADKVDVQGDTEMGEDDLCDVEEELELTPATARAHGYYKDLLNLLLLSALNPPARGELQVMGDFGILPGYSLASESLYAKLRKPGGNPTNSDGVDKSVKKARKAARRAEIAKFLADGQTEAPSFHRALHLTVARLFGAQLKADLTAMEESKKLRAEGKNDDAIVIERRISLAAKWAPTEDAMHDRYTRITESIAEYLVPLNSDRTQGSLAYSLSQYRTKVGSLRQYLEVVERHMSAKRWEEIKYNRVASKAMAKLKGHFSKHDGERFRAYLKAVTLGKATISGATLTPAVLLQQAQSSSGIDEEVVELQWKTLVNSVRDSGCLSNCVAVADVTQAPFANMVISFTDVPSFIDLDPQGTLKQHAEKISRHVGYNTDFLAVFRQILKLATKAGLEQSQMIKRVFCFSDMEFDECQSAYSGSEYATHYEIVKAEFEKANFIIPEMIFWNLASGQKKTSKAITADTPGAALVSGYSAAMVKVFLDGGSFEDDKESYEEVLHNGTTVSRTTTRMTPHDVMLKGLGHASFAGLKVYD